MSRTEVKLAGVVSAMVLMAACGGDGADGPDGQADCEPMTIGTLDDVGIRSGLYAIEQGEVGSEIVPGVEVEYMQIPALIQATGTGQYDVLSTPLPGLIDAREMAGFDLRVVGVVGAHTGGGLSVYARADAGISSAEDLSGRTVGAFGFGSAAIVQAQLVLAEKYGLDAFTEDGEISWVELDPPTLLNALAQGDIDAAVLFFQAAWLADQNPELVNVAQLDEEYREIADGAWPVGSAFTVEASLVEESAACVNEVQRMIEESVAYAEENIADFADEIAAETNSDPDFVTYWWDPGNYQFGGTVDDEWVQWAQAFYDLAYEYDVIAVEPDVNELIVPRDNG